MNIAGKSMELIAGPCSAESEEQVLETARQIAALFPGALFRAGLWKPRTRPGTFAGVGSQGLPWLQQVKKTTGLEPATEVASARHLELCSRHGINVVWIGARTTCNPFAVQEITDALKGTRFRVYIKNPVYADINVWIGAIERLHKAGIDVKAICRGYHTYQNFGYRNIPRWEIALELKKFFPGITILSDISHIAGHADLLPAVAQQSIDIDVDGLMVETHHDPSAALSDRIQQVTPERLFEILSNLEKRNKEFTGSIRIKEVAEIRDLIDELDKEIITLLAARMNYAKLIGEKKYEDHISIFQPRRFREVIENNLESGKAVGLNANFVRNMIIHIHDEALRLQEEMHNLSFGSEGKK
jgi:chorismate mutase